MENQQHFSARSLLKKAVSVTLASTMLLGMITIGNVFGTSKAYAAEKWSEGDYDLSTKDDGTIRIDHYNGTAADVSIPATIGDKTVSEVGNSAFENNDDVVSITFSEGNIKIGNYTFNDCDLLEEIHFSSTITTIGNFAFNNCRALQSVEIPATVKTLGDRAFNACPILTEVKLNEGLERMGNRFLAGTPVSEIYIPSTVTWAEEAFAEAGLLETVSFGEGITSIPNDMFEDNNSLRELTIPDTVTKLGNDSLCQMGALESIVIPDTVTEMGSYVLYECKNLASVTIGKGVTTIPYCAFSRCVRLREITIPENVTTIDNNAFDGCTMLSNVTLNEGLTKIGEHAFANTAITEIALPASLTSGSYPFNNCQKLKTIHFTEGTKTLLPGLYRNSAVETVDIPEGITELPSDLFNGCKQLTSVTLPSTLRTIGRYAFADCVKLESVDVPQSVKKIEARAFSNTSSLKTCTFHEGIQTLGDHLFSNSALTSIYIPKTLSTTESPFSESNITDVTFSEGIAKFTNELFKGAGKLTHVTIPATVVRLGSYCFHSSNIESIIIPDNVKVIEKSAFEECDNLYAVKIGAGVRTIPYACFYGCDVLQNVVIPETVLDMETSVFERSGLGYQKLPQSLRYIAGWTFKDCKNLTAVECSDALESIGDNAFERCENFTTLKTSVKEIAFNNSTFMNCPKFTDKRFYVFNPANTGIESTGNIGMDHTLVHFTVKYDIRDDWKEDNLEMNKLYLNLPGNLELVTTSFSAEGFDFDNDTYTGSYNSFDLTNGKTKGELRFSAYLNNANESLRNMSAEVEFRHNGTYFRKPLGELQFTTAKLSLFAPSSVTEPKIVVSGYTATANKDVTVTISRIKDDGTKDATVSYNITPNQYTGKYISDALNILPEGKTAVNEDMFEVSAVCNGVKSDVVSFTYTPGAVKVVKALETVNIKKFIGPDKTNLSHGSQANTYDITGVFTKGTSPVVMINPSEMLQFKIKLENDENIAYMVLMSHKGNDWRFMQLFYDAKSDMWIGEGYFNIPDHQLAFNQTYVPGALNLFYIYGERKDTYASHYYGDANASDDHDNPYLVGGKPEEEDVFYYDKDGNPHGTLGDYHDTARDTAKNVFKDIVTGGWKNIPKDVTVGGLKWLWQWGNTDNNFFKLTHGGACLGPDGLPILPGDADMYNHDAGKDGRQRNAIDPSGIVYEAVEGNPVEGATATIYKLNEESSEWEEWNAADYEQQNPLLTNNEGAYAWLTDEGKFKVTISKEGYETQTSEEFDIPPEKLGLNFSLVDKTTHPTATVTKDEEKKAYTIKFSKFMIPDTVTTETVKIEGLMDVNIEPVYLREGDEFADTFTVTGKRQQKEIKFSITDAAQSYSGVAAEATTETIVESCLIGDVNEDGQINITDATMIQQAVAELIELTAEQREAADTDGDGKITISDATMIQKYIAEIIDHF